MNHKSRARTAQNLQTGPNVSVNCLDGLKVQIKLENSAFLNRRLNFSARFKCFFMLAHLQQFPFVVKWRFEISFFFFCGATRRSSARLGSEHEASAGPTELKVFRDFLRRPSAGVEPTNESSGWENAAIFAMTWKIPYLGSRRTQKCFSATSWCLNNQRT